MSSKLIQQGQVPFDGENIVGTFDLALKRPVCEVACTCYENTWNEYSSLYNPRGTAYDSAANNYRRIAKSPKKICWVDLGKNKRPAPDMSCAISRKRRRAKSAAYLPPELMSMVISQLQEAKPRCALDLIVPDWRICRREASGSEKSRGTTRILTYTKRDFFQVGSLSCSSDHGDGDHIFAPTACFDLNALALDEGFTLEYVQALYRNHTHVFTLGIDASPGGTAEKMLGHDWKDFWPLRSQRLKAILPFDDEPTGAAKLKSYPSSMPIYKHARHLAVHSPLELMELNTHTLELVGDTDRRCSAETFSDALDLDRSAHLWFSWSKMSNLESVSLDLRIYSHDLNTKRRCLSKDEIIKRAEEMGRSLQLKTLILAGLQSYSFYRVYNGETAQEIEQLDTLDGEPNWIKIFRPAIREGGRIVLVDRLLNKPVS
ncbi:hypothetical protein F5Y09DRAFT_347987 [Xylaria sp. FL1042]|nr:hypothetical protein F5Y09DRAFT_347987 [Xylaria sp. FL1042]